LGQEYDKLSADMSKESRELKESESKDLEEPDNADIKDRDLGDYDTIFQDSSVVDMTAVNLDNLT
jgi:hypothetical protein